MRFWAVGILLVTVLAVPGRLAAQDNAETQEAARMAAEAWLALVDAGQYTRSWEAAAGYFKTAVTAAQWEKTLRAVRGPLGKTASRTLRTIMYQASLPGAPDGEYVIVQFDTVFEHKAAAIETVTPMKDADGHWRVSGYYIK